MFPLKILACKGLTHLTWGQNGTQLVVDNSFFD